MVSSDEPKATDPQPENEGGGHTQWWHGTIPSHFGETEALTTMGRNAAPFLAGFSLTASVQTLNLANSAVRWRSLTLLLFVLAAIFLIMAVQAMFWSQRSRVTPKDLMEWWPDWPYRYRQQAMLGILTRGGTTYRRWARAATISYGLGLVCLLAALTVLVVPRECAESSLRWAAVAAGAFATVGEFCWVVLASGLLQWTGRWWRKQWSRRAPPDLDEPPSRASSTFAVIVVVFAVMSRIVHRLKRPGRR
ncbi:hypothetical protein OG590_39585 (plasmid) [Streptomyces goshikiensis]|uniref:hypothetical protein n=1 Tax=Streptomyces goshikiensis TaxID=1942 RepID=UPI002F9161AC|nr:hypothetical protein OG590_39585 [Streptomyces goshikiensis]